MRFRWSTRYRTPRTSSQNFVIRVHTPGARRYGACSDGRMTADSLHLKLFRPEALAGDRHRWLGEVVVATPPSAPAAAAAALLACLLLAVSAAVVRVPERIQAAGVMLPSGRIIRVLAPRAGIVSDVGVRDGDRIREGQVLLGIHAPGVDGAQSQLAARRRSLHRELAILDSEADAAARSMRAADESDRRRILLTRERIDAAGTEGRLLETRLEIAERKLERGQHLRSSGSIAAQQLDTLQAEALQAAVGHAAAGDKQYALERELLHIESGIQQRREAAAQQELRRSRDRERVRRELMALKDEERTLVTAPAAGVAGGFVVDAGATVSSGDLLLQLVEPDADLHAHIYIGADDAGRVQEGDTIELRLRAYPYRLYGTYSVTVQRVSAVPLPTDSAALPLPAGGAVYELLARPARRPGTAEWPLLAPGATFEAEVVTRRWRLYRWLLRGGRAPA